MNSYNNSLALAEEVEASKTYLLQIDLLGAPYETICGGQAQSVKLPTVDRVSLIGTNKLKNVTSYRAISGYTGEAMISVEVIDEIDTAFGPLFVIHDPGTVGVHVGIPKSNFIEQLPARELKRIVLAAANQQTTHLKRLKDATWDLLSNGVAVSNCGRQYDFITRDQWSDDEWEFFPDAWVHRGLVGEDGNRRYAPDKEAWLLERRRAGLLDPETAEVDWSYRQIMDPYGLDLDLPEELQQIGRQYFARRPGSKIWVEYGDLLSDVRLKLAEREDETSDDVWPFNDEQERAQ
jgi:hypothetical protein